MKKHSLKVFFLIVTLFPILSSYASDYLDQVHDENEQRAAYWRERGYDFNSTKLSAYQMDLKVKDIERSKYWMKRGYDFDPTKMSADEMDLKVKDIGRSKYWKERGYDFDPTKMSADEMDLKVKDVDRSKYWKERGYDFDPIHMLAYDMDLKVFDIERSKYWKERGYNFDPTHMTSYEMDTKVAEIETGRNQQIQNTNVGCIPTQIVIPQNQTQQIWGTYSNRVTKTQQNPQHLATCPLPYSHVGANTTVTQPSVPDISTTYSNPTPYVPSTTTYVPRTTYVPTVPYDYVPNYYYVPYAPNVAENGSYYGQINQYGVPRDIYVRGYYRRDGNYVQSYYRSHPRR
jgi:hypothetical protein